MCRVSNRTAKNTYDSNSFDSAGRIAAVVSDLRESFDEVVSHHRRSASSSGLDCTCLLAERLFNSAAIATG